MKIPDRFLLSQTEHWMLSHRMDSALPGYLMLSARAPVDALHRLSEEALAQMGPLLAAAQRVVESVLKPQRVYLGRYGHSPGWSIHFHVIPVYDWVERGFWNDARYRALQAFSGLAEEVPPSTDGAELTFFIWREYCERRPPPPIVGPTVDEAIERLRNAWPAL